MTMSTIRASHHSTDPDNLENVIKRHVLEVIGKYGTLDRAASVLGVNRRTLYRWLENWGISPDNARATSH
jgi:transcriptional regulator with PAS, ATPase and Fis domain